MTTRSSASMVSAVSAPANLAISDTCKAPRSFESGDLSSSWGSFEAGDLTMFYIRVTHCALTGTVRNATHEMIHLHNLYNYSNIRLSIACGHSPAKAQSKNWNHKWSNSKSGGVPAKITVFLWL